jgi:small conductance mechanosensitive channel
MVKLLRELSRLIVYADGWPFRLLYRQHKNRVMTLHSVGLNLCKYVIYFVALGFILTELGINYTTYLASLSVIGLAIGFGTQGFVQDVVTGFFVIFEGQFAVGDMVDISGVGGTGQTGIVEELGLRMTKLRNYLNQIVVIPNRNIVVVGNFTKGAQQVYIDVAVREPAMASQANALLQRLGNELHRQFDGVIRAKPQVLGLVSLATEEYFLRLQVAIWPQQQWVIEQELLPRIRAQFATAGVEIPGDRVVAFYHLREEHAIQTWWHTRRRGGNPPPDDDTHL